MIKAENNLFHCVYCKIKMANTSLCSKGIKEEYTTLMKV